MCFLHSFYNKGYRFGVGAILIPLLWYFLVIKSIYYFFWGKNLYTFVFLFSKHLFYVTDRCIFLRRKYCGHLSYSLYVFVVCTSYTLHHIEWFFIRWFLSRIETNDCRQHWISLLLFRCSCVTHYNVKINISYEMRLSWMIICFQSLFAIIIIYW